ncbi:MAG: PHP domain-containing protein [Gemmatimonadales bacterium]
MPPWRSPRGPYLPALALTGALLLAQLFRVPALSDPVGAALPAGLHLESPWLTLALGPLFDMWDGVSMLAMGRLTAWLGGVLVLFGLWRVIAWALRRRDPERRRGWVRGIVRELLTGLAAIILILAFLAGGALWHRPMLALAGAGPGMMVVDMHSHTRASHDVGGTLMDGYDAAALGRWHDRAGFDAAFITDHNTVEGLPDNPAGNSSGTALCPGIEISAWRAHMILLGATVVPDRSSYPDSLDGVLTLIGQAGPVYGAVTIASLPEYDRNHWNNLNRFVAAGLDGFEIVNASPKANEFGRAHRDSVIELARRNDLMVVGVSDSHGWGATSMTWNLVRLPGWRARGEAPCTLLLDRLRRGGFDAVQVVERHRLRADAAWPQWASAIGVAWETWRALPWPRVLSWLAWIWGVAFMVTWWRRE